MSFKGRVALVTGGGRGIGQATAKLLAERGASVICNSVTETAQETANQIAAVGGKAIAIRANVADSKAVSAMVAEGIKTFGHIDILVNNAAFWSVPHETRIEEVKEEDWDKVVDVNLKGAFLCCKYIIPHMRENKYGRIINVSSTAGDSPSGGSGVGAYAYTSSKAGLMGLTRKLASEHGLYGITVNCVSPGLVPTRDAAADRYTEEQIRDMIMLGRVGTPMEVAYVIAFFASDESSWVTGQTITVNGGAMARPRAR